MSDETMRKYEVETIGLPGLKMVLVEKNSRDFQEKPAMHSFANEKPVFDKQSTVSRLIAHLKDK
jgi:hypothetical protein